MRTEKIIAALASVGVLLPGAVYAATTQTVNAAQVAPVVSPTAKSTNLISTSLYDTDGDRIGYATFYDISGEVSVQVSVWKGLSTGFHGLHVHANDNPSNGSGCTAAGTTPFGAVDGHYEGNGEVHGEHDGDLPMLLADDENQAYLYTKASDDLDFSELKDRALIVHSGPDNYANIPLGDGPTEYTANSQAAIDSTQSAGNSGTRVACGVLD